MAFGTTPTTLGSNNSKSAGTTVVITTGATANAGDLVVVRVAWDNVQTTDGASTTIDSVSDSAGNTYTKVPNSEETETSGAAADGVAGAMFYSVLSSTLSSGGTITVTGDSATAKAAAAESWTIDESSVDVEAVNVVRANDAEPADNTLSSMTSREYLLVLGMAQENTNVTITQDADYTALGRDFTPGGGSQTNVQIGGGYRIATLTGDTVGVATNSDVGGHVYTLVAFYEVAGGGPVEVLPNTGVATLTGLAPTVSIVANTSTGVAALTGLTPTASVTANPSTGVLTAVGFAPTVQTTANPTPGVVTLVGLAPTVSVTALPGAAAVVTLIGFEPTVDDGGDEVEVLPNTGILTLTGLAPTVSVVATPATGTLTLTGLAPTLTFTANPTPGTVTLTGFAPTITDFAVVSTDFYAYPSLGRGYGQPTPSRGFAQPTPSRGYAPPTLGG